VWCYIAEDSVVYIETVWCYIAEDSVVYIEITFEFCEINNYGFSAALHKRSIGLSIPHRKHITSPLKVKTGQWICPEL
jgi:hypothetical protein